MFLLHLYSAKKILVIFLVRLLVNTEALEKSVVYWRADPDTFITSSDTPESVARLNYVLYKYHLD